MSGFITVLFYPPRKQQQYTSRLAFAKVFWWRRARIYPVLALSLAVSLPTVILYGMLASPDPLKFKVSLPVYVAAEVAKQLTFTEQIFPVMPTSTTLRWHYWPTWMSAGMGVAPAAMGVNGPLWTLGAQAVFWAAFPWLSRIVHVRRTWSNCVRVVLAWWLLYVVLDVTLTWLLYNIWLRDVDQTGPLADYVLFLACERRAT